MLARQFAQMHLFVIANGAKSHVTALEACHLTRQKGARATSGVSNAQQILEDISEWAALLLNPPPPMLVVRAM